SHALESDLQGPLHVQITACFRRRRLWVATSWISVRSGSVLGAVDRGSRERSRQRQNDKFPAHPVGGRRARLLARNGCSPAGYSPLSGQTAQRPERVGRRSAVTRPEHATQV